MILRARPFLPWLVALGFFLLFLSVLVSRQEATPSPTSPPLFVASPTPEISTEQPVQVTRIIDGDTIEIKGGVRVRYIGIDTPEGGACLANEATQTNSSLVATKKVRLETDIEKYDRYGRLLAYVWVGTTLVNEALLQTGFATVTTYPPNVHYVDRFLAAQAEARQSRRGVWSDNPCPTPASQVQGAPEGCAIKGNISSSGEKIYHLPGQRYYERTKIDESKGEQWFCTEEEAVQAGWRKSKI